MDDKIPATLAECAFELINRLQRVWSDESNNVFGNIEDQFDLNDKNVLIQNEDLKLRNSLFLKYLPLPLILVSLNSSQANRALMGPVLEEDTKQMSFLKIYQAP